MDKIAIIYGIIVKSILHPQINIANRTVTKYSFTGMSTGNLKNVSRSLLAPV